MARPGSGPWDPPLAHVLHGEHGPELIRPPTLPLAGHLIGCGVKLGVGLVSGSLALLADALFSAVEALASIVALAASGPEDSRPDRDHPYGHQKFRALAVVAAAALVLFGCIELLQAALGRVVAAQQRPPALGAGALLGLLAVLCLQWILWRQQRGSLSALHPAISTLVLAGLSVGGQTRIASIDVALTLPILLVLARQGWQLMARTLPLLVDQIAIAPEGIHAVAMAIPGVLNCHDIASRGVLGQLVFIDMHLVVDAHDLPTAHRITELVEEHLEARFGPVRCTIHMEPREYASSQITFRGTHG